MTYKTILDFSIGMICKHMPLLVKCLEPYLIVLEILCLRRHDLFIKFSANSFTFKILFCIEHCLSSQAPRFSAVQRLREKLLSAPQLLKPRASTETLPYQSFIQNTAMDIQMIDADAFQVFIKHLEMQIFSLGIFAIYKALNTKHSKSDIQIDLDKKPTINCLTQLPLEYHNYVDVFLVAESDKLLPHRSYDHKTQFQPGKILDHDSMY